MIPCARMAARILPVVCAFLCGPASTAALRADDGPIRVELREQGGNWEMLRGGVPYFVRGAGGHGDKKLLAAIGGNSFRTWGIDDETRLGLDEAHALGLTVTLGHWLGHPLHQFDYGDPGQLAAQTAQVRHRVEQYKHHPAVLAWALGNEMEIAVGDKEEALWRHVNDLARMVKALDPNHPVMTVVADFSAEKIGNIHRWCPDVDIVGINTYGGAQSAAARYRAAGGTKPYILTEYGPHGIREWAMTDWGAPREPTSTEKAALFYRPIYEKSIEAEKGGLCLGGYAFVWGQKIEGTPTWHGLLYPTPDGDARLAACDALQTAWTGQPPPVPVPAIQSFRLSGPANMPPGTTFTATLDVETFDGHPPRIEFELLTDRLEYDTYQGHGTPMPASHPDAILAADGPTVRVKLPEHPGQRYFLYARAFDTQRGAAIANRSLLGEKPYAGPPIEAPAPDAFPFVVVGEGGADPYTPGGYMGDVDRVDMEPDGTGFRVTYAAADGWAGVYWQHPPNDWNQQPGGYDLRGARRLAFRARGEKGGEAVKFVFGGAGRDAPYFDTASGELAVTLTPDWKPYAIDLAEKDLRRIKTGFGWILGAQGAPVTFYLADVRYEP